MKVKHVPSLLLQGTGRRLDTRPYMSGALETRFLLGRLSARKDPLRTLTHGYNGGIYNGPKFSRRWVTSPEFGVPFVGSSAMLMADLSDLPLLSKKDALSPYLSYLRLSPGMTLISCSGTIGRMVFTRPDMDGIWSSQHIMKVVPDPAKVPPGYLYAFLSSKYGVPIVVSGTYGSIIQSIEPHHIVGLPVPRLNDTIERKTHELVQIAAEKRSRHQSLLVGATHNLFSSARLTDTRLHDWNEAGPELGFAASISTARSLRASNYTPRVRKALEELVQLPHKTLGEICRGGSLTTGPRFKRIDAEPEFGVCLIGQKQGFWLRPEGRWISPKYAPADIFVQNETVLVASSGTLGENEVYCRPILVAGRWLEHAYSQHFLRILSGDPEISGAYLFAFLRSELAFRCLRSMSTGSKQQEIHSELVARFPIPVVTDSVRSEIEQDVRTAVRLRDEADELEDTARNIVEQAIEGAA